MAEEALDILVKLSFVANDEALANINNSLAKEGTIVKELQGKIAALNKEMADGAQRSAGENKKLTDKLALVEGRLLSLTTTQKKVAQSTQQATTGLNNLTQASGRADNALLNLGRIVQDAPFGFIGIANNINPALESFQRLQAESGGTGNAIKSLTSSLTGAAGLGFAVSIVSSLLVVFGDKIFSTSKAQEDAKKSTDELTKSLSSQADAYAKLITADNDYLRSLQLEADLLKAKGVVRDQLSKSENENLAEDAKVTQKKNEQLAAQKQVLQDITNLVRLKPSGITIADYFNSAAFSLEKFTSYATKYRDTGFLTGVSKDLQAIEKAGGDVTQALYDKIIELDGKATDNTNKLQVSRAEVAAKTAERQFQLTKTLNKDIFDLEKELLESKAEAITKANEDNIKAKEGEVLLTQASLLRELALQEEIARKQNSTALRATLEGEQAKTAILITEKQKRVASLKAVSDGGTEAQINLYSAENDVITLQKQFTDNEAKLNSFRQQDVTNEGLFAEKRRLINEIANFKIFQLREDLNKKIREAAVKYYNDVEGLERSLLAKELIQTQKAEQDTFNVRQRVLQKDAEAAKEATDKKYNELFKVAEKYGFDTTALQKALDKEQELNEGDAHIRQLDALEAYYQDRISIITRKSGLEASKIKAANRNSPRLDTALAQNDLITARAELAQAQENYNRVLDDSALSEAEWAVAAEKAEKRVLDAQNKVADAQDAVVKKRINAIQEQINMYNNLVQSIGGAVNSIIDIEKSRTEALIVEQQRRVDAVTQIVDKGNAVLLKAEQDRLDALLEKQRKYEREQRAINAALVISQNLLNIAKSIGAVIEAGEKGAKTGGLPGLIISVVGAVAAIAAGIASSVQAVKAVNTTSGFFKGDHTGYGQDHEEAGVVHKNEFVMNAKTTRRVGVGELRGLQKGTKKIVDIDYGGMSKDISYVRQNEFSRNNDYAGMQKELRGVKKAIEDKPVSTMFADSRGFTEHIIGSVREMDKYKKL